MEIFLNHIRATIRWHLGAWNGEYYYNHKCREGRKRDDGDYGYTIETEAVLVGPDPNIQGEQMIVNFGERSIVNGIPVILVSIGPEDSSLSRGAIAGIVIGSVVCAALVVIAILLLLRYKNGPEVV